MDKRKCDIHNVDYLSSPLTEKNPVSASFYTYGKKEKTDFDMHFALELGIVISGKMERIYKNWEAEFTSDEIWYCGIWEQHGFKVIESPCKVLVFSIWPPMLFHLKFPESSEFNWMAPFTTHPAKRPKFLPGISKKLNELCENVEKILSGNVCHPALQLRLQAIETLLAIQTNWEAPSPLAFDDTIPADCYVKIAKAVEITFTSREFIPEEEIAARCGMSRSFFSKKFKSLMGINFSQFARDYRLIYAGNEILQTDAPIKSIALNWGFFDTSHFLRCFRNYYLCTPSEYRKKHNSKRPDNKIKMIKISRPVFETFLLHPNYRGWILPINKKGIEIEVTVSSNILKYKGIELHAILKRTHTSSITGKNSAIIKEEKWDTLPSEKFIARLDTADIADGEYELLVILWDNTAGKSMDMDTYKLKKIPKEEFGRLKTYFDENCVFYVDGKPYFPLGFYTCPEWNGGDGYLKYCNPEEIASDGPLNTVIFYGPLWEQMLDGINKYGVKILAFGPHGPHNYGEKRLNPAVRYGEEMEIKNFILKFKDHPALLGWYINHDKVRPDDTDYPTLEDHYQWISETDPDHPTYTERLNIGDLKHAAFITDIIGVSPCIDIRNPTWEYDMTEIAVKAGHGTRPVWTGVQALTGNISVEQGRCITYLAIAGGAKGLLYFTFFDMKLQLSPSEFKYRLKQQKLIAEEIVTLSPVILSAEDIGNAKALCNDKDIRFLLKKLDGKYYLLTVNSKDEKKKVKFEITGIDILNVADYFERSRSIPVKENTFVQKYEPYGVYTYVITAEQ